MLASAEQQRAAGRADRRRVPRYRGSAAAYAAIEMALWDRAGRRAGRPVAELISDTPAPRCAVNATLTALDRAGAAEQAARAAREGFGCIKLKVGVGDDAGRVAAARAAAGPRSRCDLTPTARGPPTRRWRRSTALAPAGPRARRGADARSRRHARGARAHRGARRDRRDRRRAGRALLGRRGRRLPEGLALRRDRGPARRRHARARDGRGGVSRLDARRPDRRGGGAACGRGARLPRTARACGLATLGLFAGPRRPLPVRDGAIALPAGSGLGVDP